MEELKYKVIKDIDQYNNYCQQLEVLLEMGELEHQEEIELLNVLIEHWDSNHNLFEDHDPVNIIKALMQDHQLKAKDMVSILNLSKGTVSKILNYRKGLSKESIRRLASYFKISQEAFNRPYLLLQHHEQQSEVLNGRMTV